MLAIEPTNEYPKGETREKFNTVLAQILPETKLVKYWPVRNESGMVSMVQVQKDLDRAYIETFPKHPDYRHEYFTTFGPMIYGDPTTRVTPTKAALEHVGPKAKD